MNKSRFEKQGSARARRGFFFCRGVVLAMLSLFSFLVTPQTMTASMKTEVTAQCTVPEGFVPVAKKMRWPLGTQKTITLVNLWAVWCPPCLKELPMLDSIASNPDFAIQTVHIGNNLGAVNGVFKKLNIQHLTKTVAEDYTFLEQFGFQGLPASLVVINDEIAFGYAGFLKMGAKPLATWLNCLASTQDKSEKRQ